MKIVASNSKHVRFLFLGTSVMALVLGSVGQSPASAADPSGHANSGEDADPFSGPATPRHVPQPREIAAKASGGRLDLYHVELTQAATREISAIKGLKHLSISDSQFAKGATIDWAALKLLESLEIGHSIPTRFPGYLLA
jgi:hypothetical protein